MMPTLYEIKGPWPGRLAITARPRGWDWLEDEISAWRRAGVNEVASLLTEPEAAELGLADEGAFCRVGGLDFRNLPIEDRGVPDSDEVALELIWALENDLQQGRSVAVHCRQGIGRSGMMAALLLTAGGMGLESALERVSRARGIEVPETAAQYDWAKRMADRLNAVPATTNERIPAL